MYRITRPLEALTNSLTMYQVTVYALCLIVATSLLLSALGELGFSFGTLIATLSVVLASSYIVSLLFAWTVGTAHHRASGLITALILYLTLAPGENATELLNLALVSGIAVASKYMLVWRGRHIFNPAAVALTLGSLLGLSASFWWVATPLLLPVVIIAGILIVTKTRRYAMVGMFLFTALAVSAVVAGYSSFPVHEALRLDILSGPLVFFAAVMLTEPLTSPATKHSQLLYAGLTGVLYSAQLPFVSTPSVALLVGNAGAFLLGSRTGALRMRIKDIREIAPNVYELRALPLARIPYVAGQYIEINLPHKQQDARGTRRIFSLASAPSEQYIRLTTKIPTNHASSFKRAFASLQPDTIVRGTYIGGDFRLPAKVEVPVVLIAGGIGITPFRSMITQMIHDADTRKITLFYITHTADAMTYRNFLEKATSTLDITLVPITAQSPDNFSAQMLREYVTDMPNHYVYISGPPAMVDSIRTELSRAEKPRQIRTDYFTGY